MEIKFCRCGGVLVPTGSAMKCRSCGTAVQKQAGTVVTEARKKDVIVIEDNKPDLPQMEKDCPKCNNNRAYWWLIQTRSADEPPTQFFRCTDMECKHTWREYK